jgi:alpha-1,2-mannosyltransferase
VVSVVTVVVVAYGTHVRGALTDLKVYRVGGAAWMHGVPLYTSKFPFWLPFTYPPVAAALFSVLRILPMAVAAALLTAAGLVGLGYATTLAVPARWVLLVLPCALVLEPVRTTLRFGQINLVLMALVAVDCLLPRTRYPRGLLVGVAAAVKLTPAVFILFFLARRQRGPAATAALTFAGMTGLGVLLAPADSIRYWHQTIFDPDRIGGAEFVTNQSLRGALTRLDLSELVWVVLSVGVLAIAWFGARRVQDPVTALLVTAAAGLVVSPVSWSHHWVWIVPALFVGAVRLYRNPPALAALAATAVVFTVGQRYLPHGDDRELHWTWWQHVLGNSYLLAALTFLVWTAVTHRKPAMVGRQAVAT